MTFYTQVGQLTTPASGTTTVSGLGFTPVAVIFFTTPSASAGAWGADSQISIGFAANNSGTYQHGHISNAATTAVAASANYQTKKWTNTTSIGLINYGNTLPNIYEGTVTSFNSDGFVITWSHFTAGILVQYLAIGGTDISAAAVVAWAGNSSVGDQSVTTVGFSPDLVLTIGTGSTAASGSAETSSLYTYGAIDSGGNQWAMCGGDAYNASPTNTWRIQLTDSCIVGTALANATVTYKASYSSMLSNGFKINWGTADGQGHKFVSLCLKGMNVRVGNWAKSTAAATTTDTINCGITPSAVMAFSDNYVVSGSGQTGSRMMIGASDGTNNHTVGFQAENSVTTCLSNKYTAIDRALSIADNDTQTTEAVATIGGFGSSQFVATWTTNNAVATQICYIALGAAIVNVSPTLTTVPDAQAAPQSVTAVIGLGVMPGQPQTSSSAVGTPTSTIALPLTTVPGSTSATGTVTPIIGVGVMPGQPQSATSAAGAVVVHFPIQHPTLTTVPGGSANVNVPAISLSKLLTVVPSTTSSATGTTVQIPINNPTLTVVPTTSSAANVPTVHFTIQNIPMTSPGGTADENAPTPTVKKLIVTVPTTTSSATGSVANVSSNISLTTVPTTTSASNPPSSVHITSSISITTVPAGTADENAPTPTVKKVLTTVPSTTSSATGIDNICSPTITTVPTTSSATGAVVVHFPIQNIPMTCPGGTGQTEPIVPFGTHVYLTMVPDGSGATGAVTTQIPINSPNVPQPATSSSSAGVPIPTISPTISVVPDSTTAVGSVSLVLSKPMTCPGTSSATGAVVPTNQKPIVTVPNAVGATVGMSVHITVQTCYSSVVEIEAREIDPALYVDSTITTTVDEIEIESFDGSAPISVQYITVTVDEIEINAIDVADVVIWAGEYVSDFNLDERTYLKVYATAKDDDGEAYDLTDMTINWNMRNPQGVILCEKSTSDGSITVDSPTNGTFWFVLSDTDSDFNLEPTPERPVVCRHEARLIHGTDEYIGVRGRMFVRPSQTGVN